MSDPFVDNPARQELDEQHKKCPDGYYFTCQEVNIRVHHDRSMDITEVLHADFTKQKHGIIRTIPTAFWTKRDMSEAQDGSRYAMRYNRVTVEGLTVSEQFTLEPPHDEHLDVRIGSRDILIEGPHDYQISYSMMFAENERVDVADLFYHSVIGAEWTCSSDTVLFSIEFDDEIPAAALEQILVFCGSVGNEDNCADLVLFQKDSHLISGRCFGLMPFQALTVYMPLPEGFFEPGPISIWQKLAWGAAVLTLLLLLYLLYLELRPEHRATPVVTFTPSEGLTSADVGSLIDGKVDDKDLLSLIPWMAAEGYISLRRDEKLHIVRGETPLPNKVPKYVRTIYEGFFAKGDEMDVTAPTPEFGYKWMTVKGQLINQYEPNIEKMPHLAELYALAFLMGLVCCFAQVTFGGFLLGFCVHVLLMLAVYFYSLLPFLFRAFPIRNHSFWNLLPLVLACIILVSGLCLYVCCFTFVKDCYLPFEVLYSLGAIVPVVLMACKRLNRRTPEQTRLMGEALGLKEFILTAHKDQLQMLLDADERYFYRVLPYAMAFGLVDKWTEQFAELPVGGLAGFLGGSTVLLQELKSKELLQFDELNEKVGKMYVVPGTYFGSSGWSGSDSSSSSYSSSGGSYSSSSSSSSGRYAGGGSGGGGGRSW